MTIRFAAPPSRNRCRMQRGAAQALYLRPANDNRGKQVSNVHLSAALRHFAQHGLAAADHARQQALAASEAGAGLAGAEPAGAGPSGGIVTDARLPAPR